MRSNYQEAFHITANEQTLLQLVRHTPKPGGSSTQVQVTTAWANVCRDHVFELVVPDVRPVDFPWDRGIRGDLVQLRRGAIESAPRFCHPRLRSQLIDRILLDLAALEGPERSQYLARFSAEFARITEWGWYWEGWYDRVNEALRGAMLELCGSAQYPSVPLLRNRFQRTLLTLLNGGLGGQSGLPGTDESRLLLQMFEVELGYPELPFERELTERIKSRFLAELDGGCDLLFTGKTEPGRRVMRVRPESPANWMTGRPMPEAALAINALAAFANPLRFYREGKAIAEGLVFEQPAPPPLRTPGVKIPKPWAQRMTTLLIAVGNIPHHNVYPADREQAAAFDVRPGESLCLDGLYITQAGRAKVPAFQPFQELLTAEEFLPQLPELQSRPGFQMKHRPELVEILENGTPIFRENYQYRYNRPLQVGYDKLKVFPGGVKAIVKPLLNELGEDLHPHVQLDGTWLPIDLIIAEETVAGKGARDLAFYLAATIAGLQEIDPRWTLTELAEQIEVGLKQRQLPSDGRLPVYLQVPAPSLEGTAVNPEEATESCYLPWGVALVGYAPVMRAMETEERQSNLSRGVRISAPLRNLAQVPRGDRPEVEDRLTELGGFVYKLRHHLDGTPLPTT